MLFRAMSVGRSDSRDRQLPQFEIDPNLLRPVDDEIPVRKDVGDDCGDGEADFLGSVDRSLSSSPSTWS